MTDEKEYISCVLRDNKIICYGPNKEEIPIEQYSVMKEVIVFTYKSGSRKDLFNYRLEFEANPRYRIICNGEEFGEFTWGSRRYSVWETINPVDRMLCIVGVFSIISNDTFIYSTDLVGEINESILDLFLCIRSIIKNILKWPTRLRYVFVTSELVKKYISGVLRVDNVNIMIYDLIYSSLLMKNIIRPKDNMEWLIHELSNALLGKDSFLSLLGLSKLSNDHLLKGILSNRRECISVKRIGEEILLKNRCDSPIMLFIRTNRSLLRIRLEGNEEYFFNEKFYGGLIDYFSVKEDY